MSKHTPGPWAIDWNVSRIDVFSADAATLVATIRRSTLSAGIDDVAKANARLISASPVMLEALKELDSWLVCACIATPEDMAQSFPHMQQVVSAAIAKATGEA
jgi:hypothetical protein